VPGAWKRLACRAVLVCLAGLALSVPAAADVPPPRLVGSTTLRLPATLEVVTAGKDQFTAWLSPPAPGEPSPGILRPITPSGQFVQDFAMEIRRARDSSGMYHHFMRLEAAPLGTFDLNLNSPNGPPDYGTAQATVSVQVASSRFHGFKLYPPTLIQQTLRFGQEVVGSPYLVAYTQFLSTTQAPVAWRTVVELDHRSGKRWYPSKQADSGVHHVLDPFNVDTGATYLNLVNKLAAIRQAIRHGVRFRVVVTTTATSGRTRSRVRRTAYPWRPTTRPTCTLVLGAARLCTFPPGITGG